MVRAAADGRPEGQLLLGVDDLIGAVAQQEFLVDAARGTRDDVFRAELAQAQRCLQGALEVVADGDDAGVEVAHAERLEEVPVRAVRDQRAVRVGQHLIDELLILVHRHDLVVHRVELARDMAAIAAEADQ